MRNMFQNLKYKFAAFMQGRNGVDQFSQFLNVIVIPFETCRTNDRGCKCRKTAGEESPGFIGQDAG